MTNFEVDMKYANDLTSQNFHLSINSIFPASSKKPTLWLTDALAGQGCWAGQGCAAGSTTRVTPR